ncbi:hypothetical protein YC2023_071202 [Brassica napus]
MCLDAKASHLSSTLPPTLPWKFNKPVQPNKGLTRQGNGHSEELRCVIAVIRQPGRESDSDPEDLEHAEKLRQVKAVLEESRESFGMAQGGNFSGIYMKVQLKPLKWDGEGEEEKPVEALMILKYGSVLTHAGFFGRKDSSMLDGLDTASIEMEAAMVCPMI